MRKRSRRMPVSIATVAAAIIRTFGAGSPAALLDVAVVEAQDTEPNTLVTDIPAQPLAEALAAFANQTGLQMVYVSGIVEHQQSRAVRAGTRARDALPLLLRMTGLKFEYLTSHSIRILRATPSQNRSAQAATEMPDDIIVTANRRDEALQNVPITIQVLTGATLSDLNAVTMDDLVAYFPGVTAHGVGPAQNNLYVRGLGTTENGNQGAGSNGVLPNVAIYLDEQSAQLPGRNLDIYAVDLERIEVLEGPQGTLFGAGAEAGAIRYITNKPKLNATEAAVDARYSTTAHGAPSSAVDAIINLPLIADTLTFRGVIYDDRRGGYIDNIPATFARTPGDASIAYAKSIVGGAYGVPTNSVTINNAALVEKDINPVSYQGIRAQVFIQFDESWSALLAQTYQLMEADGVFAETTADSLGVQQPALTTQLFNPSYDKDRFENTALTVNRRAGGLDFLYAGSFSVRNVDQVQDYTNYARGGAYADYYQCVNPGKTAATARCFSPSSTWEDHERNTHQSHEVRLSTSADRRVRAISGVFYETYVLQDEADWRYLTATPYFNAIGPPTGYFLLNGKVVPGEVAYGSTAVFVPGSVTSNNANIRSPNDSFFNDTTHGYRQGAAFASVDWDLVPRALTLTTGTRYFHSTTSEAGSSVGSFGCSLLFGPPAPSPCLNREATNLDALGLNRHYSGFRSRASLSWLLNSTMLYASWSQGFRPGGFNRGFVIQPNSPLYAGTASYQAQALKHQGFNLPSAYEPDNLTNTEVGWRTTAFDGHLRWNGTLYQENWMNAQIFAAGQEFGAVGLAINGGTYRVRGVESSATLQLARKFTIEGSAAWNHGRLVKEGLYYWRDGTPIDFNTLEYANQRKVTNFGGVLDSPLSGAPAFQGSVRARYEFDINDARINLQAGATHQAHSLASTTDASIDAQDKSAVYDLAPFTTVEAAIGIAKGGWNVQGYCDNLTDTRAQLFADYYNFVKTVTTNRPRTLGVRFSYKFGTDGPGKE